MTSHSNMTPEEAMAVLHQLHAPLVREALYVLASERERLEDQDDALDRAYQSRDDWKQEAARLREEHERLRDGLRRIEWYIDVDVNGEYTTTKPRDVASLRAEIDSLLAGEGQEDA